MGGDSKLALDLRDSGRAAVAQACVHDGGGGVLRGNFVRGLHR